MPTLFLTGFPGFLGSALIRRLLDRHAADTTLTCLIQRKFRPLAERRVAEIEGEAAERAGRIRLIDGDITAPDLGLGAEAAALQRETEEIYHLAAVYDLAVARDLAMRVNVDGTRHMLRFAEACPNLRRFQYVSTCYVSGSYPGIFMESDLDKGQTFNNFYEETKYLAEADVQQRMQDGLPATIYRPAIVTGNSRTGETQKYDGPYYFIQWVLRWKQIAPLPVLGNPHRYEVNVVPRDFVVDALDYLSGLDASEGQVYQLCDPTPPTVDRVIRIIADATDRLVLRIPMPPALARAALEHVPGLQAWMRIPPEAVDYYVHPTHYTCENTLRDLDGSGIRCPSYGEYAHRLVEFMIAHPEITSAAMV